MGEGITLAARMETEAQPGTVLVSENTFRLVSNRFHWQPLGELQVKGISEPVNVFRPLSPRFDFEAVPDLLAYGMPVALTGREMEFERVKEAIKSLYQGRGGIVLVAGEKGLGKTLLITQVRHHFNRYEAMQAEQRRSPGGGEAAGNGRPGKQTATWLRSVCRSYDQSWPFSMWMNIFYEWLGMRPDEPPDERSARLLRGAQRLWGDAYERYFPYLAKFLSIPTTQTEHEEKLRYLDAQGLNKQIFITIRSWVETMARMGPLIISFVDLQWADLASLELLKFCLPASERLSLVWLLIMRPERQSLAWEFRHYVETEYPHRLSAVDLQPLTDEESHALIHEMVGAQALSQKTEALIIAKAEGNPYFVREIISSLINNGVLEKETDGKEWRETKAVTTLDLPDSLQSLMLERIDRLSLEERKLLQAASVMGHSFWSNVLEELLNGAGSLEQNLTSLQKKGLIQELSHVPGLGKEYSFNSALVWDVVYDSLLVNQKFAYHNKVAVFLEDCACLEEWLQHSSLIAYHYKMAGNKHQELFYTIKASQQAQELYAMNEALEHLSHALELLSEIERESDHIIQDDVILAYRFDILNDRSAVNNLLGFFTESVSDAKALLDLADELSDEPHWRVDALLKQAEVKFPENRQELESGLLIALEALQISRDLGDRDRELISLTHVLDLQFMKHDHAWKENAETALALAKDLGNVLAQVNILLTIGSSYGIDELEMSKEYLQKAIPLSQELGDKTVEMKILRAFAGQYERSGDYYRQLTDFEQKRLQISRETGNRTVEGDALMHCGQVQSIYLGDHKPGLKLLRESLRFSEGTSASLFPLLRIAQVLTVLGMTEEAKQTLERAHPFVEKHVFDLGRAGFWLVSALLMVQFTQEEQLNQALAFRASIEALVSEKLVSRQYLMAAESVAANAFLKLANISLDEQKKKEYLEKALEASRLAVSIYAEFGFVQVIECSSEEIFYRYFLAQQANGNQEEAAKALGTANQEMLRKWELIPAYSHYRDTFLNQVLLHQDITEQFAAQVVPDVSNVPANQPAGVIDD